ncbi:MAG: iron-sulfur cluster-binding domain-containing protein [Mollicutes bacterium]|nr:iron-sulfur cluster-binding domain-containing protein [Mollicutes bacterium]
MKTIKISSFPNKDFKKFKKIKEYREKIINKTSPSVINNEYIVDRIAKSVHPSYQKLMIKNIIDVNDDIKIFYFCNADGGSLATFRPGQYITLQFQFDNKFVSRAYSLSSSPKDALNNVYRISVTRIKNGIVSNYMLDKLKIGDIIYSLSPSGYFFPSSIRDKKQIVGLASGYGISPLLSIAKSIEDKTIDKDITIFYEAKDENSFIYKDELKRLSNTYNNIKVIFINRSNTKNRITVNMIKSFITSNFTVFACGGLDFYAEMKNELSILNLDIKDMRFESSPLIEENIADTIETPNVVDIVVEEPKKKKKKKVKDEEEGEEELPDIEVSEQTPTELPKQYNIKIFSNDEEYNVTCFENQTILSALELSNVRVRSKCRCGECGYCRSLLLWGTIRVKEDMEHRRKADIKFNYIHPCCSYPTSDITIKIDN